MRSEHKIIRALYFLLFGAMLVLGVFAFKTLFIPLLLGFLLAFLAAPIVDWLERRRWPRPAAALMFFALLFVVLGVLLYVLAPRLIAQMQYIVENQNDYLALLDVRIATLKATLGQILSMDVLDGLETDIKTVVVLKVANIMQSLPALLVNIVSWGTSMIFVPIIAFFFLVQGSEMKKAVVSLLPNSYFEMTLMIIHQVNCQLGGYLRGQALDCIINGSIYAVGLSLLGVKAAPLWGIFAGLMNAVPYAGPVIGALPGMFILLLDPTASMPWWTVPVMFTVVHLFDSTYIYPMTVGKSLDLPPFAVILGIIFGGSVAGILGMFLTVPLMGMAKQAFGVFHSTLKSYRII